MGLCHRGLLTGATGYVIGRYPEYIVAAEEIGAGKLEGRPGRLSFFNGWGRFTTLNQAYLNAQIFFNQSPHLSNVPLGQEGSAFSMELEYLITKGVGPDQWRYVPLPFLWY